MGMERDSKSIRSGASKLCRIRSRFSTTGTVTKVSPLAAPPMLDSATGPADANTITVSLSMVWVAQWAAVSPQVGQLEAVVAVHVEVLVLVGGQVGDVLVADGVAVGA